MSDFAGNKMKKHDIIWKLIDYAKDVWKIYMNDKNVWCKEEVHNGTIWKTYVQAIMGNSQLCLTEESLNAGKEWVCCAVKEQDSLRSSIWDRGLTCPSKTFILSDGTLGMVTDFDLLSKHIRKHDLFGKTASKEGEVLDVHATASMLQLSQSAQRER